MNFCQLNGVIKRLKRGKGEGTNNGRLKKSNVGPCFTGVKPHHVHRFPTDGFASWSQFIIYLPRK